MAKCADCGATGQLLHTCTRCGAEYCDDCIKDDLCYVCYSARVANKLMRKEDDADFKRKQQIEDAMTGDA